MSYIPNTKLWRYLQRLPWHSIDPNDASGELVKKWTERFARPDGKYSLRPEQAAILETLSRISKYKGTGGFIQSAVGSGKTLAILLLASLYDDVTTTVVLVPPDLVEEIEREMFKWRDHFFLGDKCGRMPKIIPYSQLSQAKSSALLRHINPDLIIADESQKLGNPEAARTKRFFRHFAERPNCRFVALTGTITDQSINEYAHLLRMAVRQLNFIPDPKDRANYNAWRSVIDVEGRPNADDVRAMQPLCSLAGIPWPTGVAAQRRACRRAFNKRLASTYGVLLTTESSTDSVLLIEMVQPDFGPQLLQYLEDAEGMKLPNGDAIVDGTEKARHLATLSIGFFNRWDWDSVDADSAWDRARKNWASACRAYLKDHSREGRDSPALVEKWVREENPRNNTADAFWAWDKVRDKQAPPTVPVWVSNEVLMWAREWLYSQNEPAILWYYSRAVGDRLAAMGVDVRLKKPKPDYRRQPQVALPMSVFHKGHNMQEYRNCLVIEPWSSGKNTEQLLGRNHRNGQTLKCNWALLGHTKLLRTRITKSISRAQYIEDSTQQKQKILGATWKNPPKAAEKFLKGFALRE